MSALTTMHRVACALVPGLFAVALGAAAMETPYPMHQHGHGLWHLAQMDQLEYRAGDGTEALRWDGFGWIGGDWNRLWIRSEGEHAVGQGATDAELHILGSRLVAPFWEAQAGVRLQGETGDGADHGLVHGVLALQGLAPYRFETTAALFLSTEGDLSLRLASEREWLVTQRLALEARFEVEAAASRLEALDTPSGLNRFELGLRLRYYVEREFAPYLGVHFERRLGNTADSARAAGAGAGDLQIVGGVSFCF
ncbi:MAG: copper resistance protein B [Gammaproteobacteria bacterium]